MNSGKKVFLEDWLGADNTLGLDIWRKKYCFKGEDFSQWLTRVSAGDKSVENLILEKKFLFGGRILSNRGVGKYSLANCATLGRVEDSIEGIMETCKQLALSFKAQQGQGLSLSNIRPKDANVSDGTKSCGTLPFMELFNSVTDAIKQNGRRGALLMSMSAWHKDIEDFITVKSNLEKITNANLSVEVSNSFMDTVKKDWANKSKTTVEIKKTYADKVIQYDVVPTDIFALITKNAHASAEPCLLFMDVMNNYNLMEFVDEYQIEGTNACSEEPLPKHGMCILGSFNISAYVKDGYTSAAAFDYASFKKDIPTIVRAMDDIVDENIPLCPLEQQRDAARKWRNIGIGMMGLADMFVMLGIRYGSPEAISLLNEIGNVLFKEALKASSELGKKRGNFEGYNEKVWDAEIIKAHLSDDEINALKANGLRNASLLSIAPCGTIGTMIGVSTGIEPFFALAYNRTTKSLDDKDTVYSCKIKALEDYQHTNNTDITPSYFITAHDIAWKDRIDMQAILQKHIDAAISSTVNLSETTTVDEVKNLFLYAYEKGLKGISIYRDGSRAPILEVKTETKDKTEKTENLDNIVIPIGFNGDQYIENLDVIAPSSRKELGEKLYGVSYKKATACGGLYIQINNTEKKNIVEVFSTPTYAGGCQANLQALSRMISDSLRCGIKVDSIVDSLRKVQCQACMRAKASGIKLSGNSCADVIAKCLRDRYEELKGTVKCCEDIGEITKDGKRICPECGAELSAEGGCFTCHTCGYSKCAS